MVLGARLKYQQLEEIASSSSVTCRPTTVTFQLPAAVQLQDAFPSQSSVNHFPQTLPSECFSGATQRPGTTSTVVSCFRCQTHGSSFTEMDHILQPVASVLTNSKYHCPPINTKTKLCLACSVKIPAGLLANSHQSPWMKSLECVNISNL